MSSESPETADRGVPLHDMPGSSLGPHCVSPHPDRQGSAVHGHGEEGRNEYRYEL